MDGSAVSIRPAVPGDREVLWSLVRAFAVSYVPAHEVFIESFDLLVGREDTLVLVAETANGALVGYLLGSRHGTFFANGPVVWVEEVMVDGRSRRLGVGRALMSEAERWAAGTPAAYLALASRRAGAFYLSLGYQDSATYYRKTFVPPTGR